MKRKAIKKALFGEYYRKVGLAIGALTKGQMIPWEEVRITN